MMQMIATVMASGRRKPLTLRQREQRDFYLAILTLADWAGALYRGTSAGLVGF